MSDDELTSNTAPNTDALRAALEVWFGEILDRDTEPTEAEAAPLTPWPPGGVRDIPSDIPF
jgi:hypothetical protein